jgi:hypothetical protein
MEMEMERHVIHVHLSLELTWSRGRGVEPTAEQSIPLLWNYEPNPIKSYYPNNCRISNLIVIPSLGLPFLSCFPLSLSPSIN